VVCTVTGSSELPGRLLRQSPKTPEGCWPLVALRVDGTEVVVDVIPTPTPTPSGSVVKAAIRDATRLVRGARFDGLKIGSVVNVRFFRTLTRCVLVVTQIMLTVVCISDRCFVSSRTAGSIRLSTSR
jgi:hypothetical protein